MKVLPPNDYKSTVSVHTGAQYKSNAAPGLPDKLREGVAARPMNTQLNDRHPLESRLNNWDDNKLKRDYEQYKQVFGLAEPVRRMMELKIVEQTDFNPVGGCSNIHKEILLNKEASLDWEDVFPDSSGIADSVGIYSDVHTQIESSLGI